MKTNVPVVKADNFRAKEALSSSCECEKLKEDINFVTSGIAREELLKLEAECARLREELAWIRKILPDTNEQIDAYLKDRTHELYHLLCVDVPTAIDNLLTHPQEPKEDYLTIKPDPNLCKRVGVHTFRPKEDKCFDCGFPSPQEPLPWVKIECPDCGGCGTDCNGAEYEKPCRGLCKGAGKLYINRKDILSRFPERGGGNEQ